MSIRRKRIARRTKIPAPDNILMKKGLEIVKATLKKAWL
jgi:hypothetical protein